MVNKWEIYFSNLNPVKGSEQRGIRPVLIVSSDAINHSLSISTVLPISSIKGKEKMYPSEILLPIEKTGLPKHSVAMVQQIRTIYHNRLINKCGIISDEDLQKQISDVLIEYFDI